MEIFHSAFIFDEFNRFLSCWNPFLEDLEQDIQRNARWNWPVSLRHLATGLQPWPPCSVQILDHVPPCFERWRHHRRKLGRGHFCPTSRNNMNDVANSHVASFKFPWAGGRGLNSWSGELEKFKPNQAANLQSLWRWMVTSANDTLRWDKSSLRIWPLAKVPPRVLNLIVTVIRGVLPNHFTMRPSGR